MEEKLVPLDLSDALQLIDRIEAKHKFVVSEKDKQIAALTAENATINGLLIENKNIADELVDANGAYAILLHENEELTAELNEWKQDSKHVIDIIHDATAQYLVRAEIAEAERDELRREVEKYKEGVKNISNIIESLIALIKWCKSWGIPFTIDIKQALAEKEEVREECAGCRMKIEPETTTAPNATPAERPVTISKNSKQSD